MFYGSLESEYYFIFQSLTVGMSKMLRSHFLSLQENFYIIRNCIFSSSTFDSSPVGSIWLEISMNWHTKSQGPKKMFIHFTSYIAFCSTFDASPVGSIWLEISMNWHTKSQGPNKKCINFSRGRINPCPGYTARN